MGDNENENLIQPLENGVKNRDVLDALELACEVRRRDEAIKCGPQPEISGDAREDLIAAQDYLTCQGNQLIELAKRQVLANVPVAALNGLDGSYQFKGERGAAAGEFAAAIIAMRDHHRNVSLELKNFASTIQIFRNASRDVDIQHELNNLRFVASAANHAASCASSIFESVITIASPVGDLGSVSNAAKASSTVACMNALFQVGIAWGEESLLEEQITLHGSTTLEEFKIEFREHAEAIVDNVEAFEEQATLMRAALAKMENQRTRGQRLLAIAMHLGGDHAGRQFNVNTVLRRRYNTLRIRYENARRDAVAMAWIARRAIEQRLGLDLSQMHEDMSLVDAPAHWAETVCTSTGLDYARIRDESGLEVDDYADGFIGDYVRKLELVVLSYLHDHPFSDAADTAVISLRDDVTLTRELCEVDVSNLLGRSAELDMGQDAETGDALWVTENCPTEDCVRVDLLLVEGLPDMPLPMSPAESGTVPGFEITFAPAPHVGSIAGSALAQTLTLSPGYYRVSWYGNSTGTLAPEAAVMIRNGNGAPISTVSATELGPDPGPFGWRRYHRLFEIATLGAYEIAVVPDPTLAATGTEHSVQIAAIMVEDIDSIVLAGPGEAFAGTLAPVLFPPGEYVATTRPGTANGLFCEDVDGSEFRKLWQYGCEMLCPSGFGSCGGEAESHCFWELSFSISLDGIETGGLLKQSGFAYGNYNYRADDLAVNFVGTALRDCTNSATPSTCFGSGTIAYSIAQNEPYEIRNYEGERYEAPLFPGRIEHGRGLAAERYLTNPLSSADRSLLQDMWHGELRGRPLTGSYTIRLWDADGVTIRNLEDVQVVLNYRYWTPLTDNP